MERKQEGGSLIKAPHKCLKMIGHVGCTEETTPKRHKSQFCQFLAITTLKRDSWNLKYVTQQILVCNVMVLPQAYIFLKIIKASFVKG